MIHMDFFANWSATTRKKMVRGSAFLGLLIASSFSFGQTIDNKPEVRKEILDTIAKVVDDRAFVPGVDFKKWSEFITNEQAKIDEAKNDDAHELLYDVCQRKAHQIIGCLFAENRAELQPNGLFNIEV